MSRANRKKNQRQQRWREQNKEEINERRRRQGYKDDQFNAQKDSLQKRLDHAKNQLQEERAVSLEYETQFAMNTQSRRTSNVSEASSFDPASESDRRNHNRSSPRSNFSSAYKLAICALRTHCDAKNIPIVISIVIDLLRHLGYELPAAANCGLRCTQR